jgi:hypothetical protein
MKNALHAVLFFGYSGKHEEQLVSGFRQFTSVFYRHMSCEYRLVCSSEFPPS